METKKKIRQEILSQRNALLPEEKLRMSEAIFQRIVTLPEFQQAEKVLLFAGYGSEPDTLAFLDEIFKAGKRVFCPLVEGETMDFFEIADRADISPGYKGIPEPKSEPEKRYIPSERDFMLVPGTVFDRKGNRIGYGKGFYDKFLSDVFFGKTAAVGFSFQIVEDGRIPVEKTDRKMSCIVTETEIIRI